jgi:dCTP diphosphatase
MSSEYKDIINKIQLFSDERDWSQFHTPKNLVLSIVSEIGELAEIVQWKSDEQLRDYLEKNLGRKAISDEIADIAIYLIRLCQQQNLDLLTIIESKLETNSLKYPVHKSKGSSLKYTDL